ncbi:MAG: hypothetical protein LCH69_00555 [Proteobacteria bacterium]|nr:hypothetical protein [Pseudomonadota bacterium]
MISIDSGRDNPISRPTLKSRCVVYVTDPGFLVPSIVSARQVLKQASGIADVVIALNGFRDEDYPRLSTLISDLGMVPCMMPYVCSPDPRSFTGHVPPAAMARLDLPKYLPPMYRNILYIDGDTQIVGDIRALLELTAPKGQVAAAPDSLWLGHATKARYPKDYLPGLGQVSRSVYFNSGVLAMSRETMDAVFPQALEFFLENPEKCLYHDQSALNAVMAGRVAQLSPRYNFITDYLYLGVLDRADPAILHFTGRPKPWINVGWPWFGRFMKQYSAPVQEFSELRPFAKVVSPEYSARIERDIKRTRQRYRMAFPITAYRRWRFLTTFRRREYFLN